MKILIVDDNEDSRLILKKTLESVEHTVEVASNGTEAMEMARESPPDMIISDILMPVMDGFTLCREWKKDEQLKYMPFIFYTATYTDSKDEDLALKMGADRFIVKPVEPDKFINIIQDVIRDAEKGQAKPRKPVLEEEKEVFKLYSERLVNKLEKKMLDLEKEITKRERTENQIKASLREKELLIREIYHRTKNNMQVIISMLQLQSASIGDENVSQLLKEIGNRIKAMALVHQKLYKAKNLSGIDLKDYIKTLSNLLVQTYRSTSQNVAIQTDMDNVFLNIDYAVPCGLIINELLTNALKYAFPGDAVGEIKIDLKRDDKKEIELLISDNGIGLPKSFDIVQSSSLGLQIVSLLTEQQLDGQLNLLPTKGTKFQILFKDTGYKVRI